MRPSLLLAGVALLAGCGSAPAPDAKADEPVPVTVDMATATARDVRDTLAVDGRLVLAAGESSRLAPSVTGRLAEVLVREGDRVTAGQVLARLDTRALVAQSQSAAAAAGSAQASAQGSVLALQVARADGAAAVRTAEVGLATARAEGAANVAQAAVDLRKLRAGARPQEVAVAQSALQSAIVARDKARLDADRDARLFKEGLVAGSQADASAAALKSAEFGVQSARSALDLVRAGTRPEDLRAAELRLSAAKSLAGKRVEAAKAVVAQAQASRLGAKAKAQDAAALRLAATQKAADARAASAGIAAAVLRSPITGFVSRRFLNSGDTADPTTPVLAVVATRPETDFLGSASPTEARRIRTGMSVELPNASGITTGKVVSVGEPDPATGLVPVRARLTGVQSAGGFVTARVVLSTLTNVPTVPKGAVVSKGEKAVVFVVKDGVAHETEVTLGPEENGLIAIRKGIAPGAQVVALGGHELSDGTKVEPATKEKAK